jgi:hypothetical protein
LFSTVLSSRPSSCLVSPHSIPLSIKLSFFYVQEDLSGLKDKTNSADVIASLSHIQEAISLIQDRLPPSPEATAQLLEAALDTRTCRVLEAVDSFKAASREQQQQLLDSWDKAKIPENLEKLGKNITVLGVKLDMGGTASAARGGGAAARGTETAGSSSSSEPTAEQAQQLTAALADLGKNLSSQLDDVHDMVFNAEESTARVLAEIKAEVKVVYLLFSHTTYWYKYRIFSFFKNRSKIFLKPQISTGTTYKGI